MPSPDVFTGNHRSPLHSVWGIFFQLPSNRVIRHWSTARSSEWLSGVILRRTLAERSARPNCRDVLQAWLDGLGMVFARNYIN
jgi:hypothetical protein